MLHDLPRVSVIIPNHNYGKWIGDAIESAASQDYDNVNIIVVDDGSTDNSWEVICNLFNLKFKEEPVNIAYQSKYKNRDVAAFKLTKATGPSAARNLGIQSCLGFTDIFGFLDADDIWLSGKISKSVAKIMTDPQHIGLVYTDNDSLNVETGLQIREFRESFNYKRMLNHNMVHSQSLVTKQALQKVGLFDENLRVAEDYDLYLRIAEHFMLCHIPESLVVQRIHKNNTTNSIDMSVWQNAWKYIGQKLRQKYVKKQ